MPVTNAGLASYSSFQSGVGGAAKFRALAIGSGATAFAATQTALVAELTTNGGGRQAAAAVTQTLVTVTFANDTLESTASWTITGALTLREVGSFDNDTASTGTMEFREVYPGDLPLAAGYIVGITTRVIRTMPDNVTLEGVTRAGVVEFIKLAAFDLTAAFGAWTHIAVGSGSTNFADTQTTLVTEITTNGLARAAATASRVTTTVTNDTAQWTKTFTVTGLGAGVGITAREYGLFNQSSGGTMAMRFVDAADATHVDNDAIALTLKLINTGS